jgi:hypothetical protein
MSTPQGGKTSDSDVVRVVKPAKPAAGAKKAPSKAAPQKASAAKAAPVKKDGRQQSSSRPGGPNRRPAPIVKVAPKRNWTPIYIITAASLVAIAIIGYAVYQIHEQGLSFQQKADKISGIVDYRETKPKMLTQEHTYGVVNYTVTPPVGGNHNYNYQRCAGDVYTAQIANENAVHALEHGAVWVTYDPATLPAAQVQQLANMTKGYQDYMLMSPYPNQGSPISLQAWGFQLKVNDANDPRIKQFIEDLRINASMEPGVPCSTGAYVTATGTQPHNLGGVPPSATPSASAPSTPTTPSATSSK